MATYKMDLPEGGFLQFQAPDDAAPDQLQAAAAQRYAQHQSNLKTETAKVREQVDPTKDMSGTDAVLANLGAGFANLGQGAQALSTKAFGNKEDQAAMDADVWEKRARDQQLADSTRGGGMLQLAGEVLPTLAIPVGGLAAGARGAYSGAKALATRGAMDVGREALAGGVNAARGLQATQEAGNLGTVLKTALQAQRAFGPSSTADAALAGGLSGALAPTTSDESTLGRIAGGTLLGGAVPFLGRKATEYAQKLNPWGSGEGAASKLIGEQLAGKGAGDTERVAAAQRVADQIRNLPSQQAGAATADIPLSTAAQLGDENLAWLEVGNRARNASNWAGHDTAYQQGLANTLEGATSEAGQVGARYAKRTENWDANMQDALQHADPEVFADHVQALQNHVEDWLAHSPERFDKPVRKVYEDLQSDLASAGESFNPQDMQVIRRAFNGKAKFNNPSSYASAPRESAAVQDVIGRLDNALDETTGGRWSNVKEGYTQDVANINQAKAALRLKENFYTPEGRIRGTASGVAGDLPSLTEAGFQRASGKDERLFSPEAQAQVDAIQNAIRAQNITQRVKKSGTAGGGSATAPTMFAAKDADSFGKTVANALRGAVPGGQYVGNVVEGLGNVANYHRDRVIADALQNPGRMLQLLERVQASGQPLSASQRALLQSLRQGSTAAARTATE